MRKTAKIGHHEIALRYSLWIAIATTAMVITASASVGANAANSQSGRESMLRLLTSAVAKEELEVPEAKFQLASMQVKRLGNWTFVHAKLEDGHGQPFDYAGTAHQDAAELGLRSSAVVTLPQLQNDVWTKVDLAVGPLMWLRVNG